ncbi:7 TM domain-containing transmembrane protein [Acrasis kona]|uniref:7 TM domain-containing transmembrane protein n=1 Tax=Acrasis kona TaxID=1008807 RepID=A0AAW2ZGH8_9EUKA
MCWDIKYSAAFTVFHLATAAYMYKRNFTFRDRAYVLLCLLYGSMELLEFLSWIVVEPYSKMETNHKCNDLNKYLTIASFVHLSVQPVVWCIWAQRASIQSRKNMFTIPIVMAIVYAVVNVVRLYFGEVHELEVQNGGPNSNAGIVTCTYEGPNSHVAWKFKLSNYERFVFSFPTWFTYMHLSTVFFFVRPLYMSIFTPTVFFGLCALSGYLVGFSIEHPSYWCLTSVGMSVLMLLEPAIVNTLRLNKLDKEKSV